MMAPILKYCALCLLLAAGVLCAGATAERPYKLKTVVIDAGHGGRKPGARGKKSVEKNIALAVAMKTGAAIKAKLPGVRIIYTRTTDKDVDFLQRAATATRNHADLFISIHCNSQPNGRNTRGTETFVAGSHRLNEQNTAVRENADIVYEKNYKSKYGGYDPKDPATFLITGLYKNIFRDQSLKFAKILQGEYVKSGRPSRGIKEQGILILQRCGTPAVLTEIGFISNSREEAYLMSSAGQAEVAENISNAVRIYSRNL